LLAAWTKGTGGNLLPLGNAGNQTTSSFFLNSMKFSQNKILRCAHYCLSKCNGYMWQKYGKFKLCLKNW